MLSEILFEIPDFRRGQGKRFELGHLLHMSIMAIASNATSYSQIHIFIKEQFPVLKKKLLLNWKYPPSYSSIRRVILRTASAAAEIAFRKDANSRELKVSYEDDLQVISFDGKVIRGSFDDYNEANAIQVLSFFSKNSQLIIAHEVIQEKTNEIPIAQELIPKLGLKNAVFTADALSAQEKTIEIICNSGNEFVVQVKGNQKSLLEKCINTAETGLLVDEFIESPEKGHGRIEFRQASVFNADLLATLNNKWGNLESVIQVKRFSEIFNTKTKKYEPKPEVSYYVATNQLPAINYNEIIRGHWGIENSNHYVKDVTFKEDASRIRINPQNMVRLRSWALNILRDSGIENIAASLYENSINIKKLFKLKIW
jgi:predicted transposase YbfD/YdcC